jgi:hypothetical protein
MRINEIKKERKLQFSGYLLSGFSDSLWYYREYLDRKSVIILEVVYYRFM